MRKFIYFIGIYHLCLGLHEYMKFLGEIGGIFYKVLKQSANEEMGHLEKKEKVVGFHAEDEPVYRTAHSEMNRIGF